MFILVFYPRLVVVVVFVPLAVGVPRGVPRGVPAPDADVLVGLEERAIIFWRTSRIFSWRQTFVGNASECLNWNDDVAYKD